MNSALKLTILFTFLYTLVTQQVLANTWIRRLDEWIYERDFLLITPGKTPTMVMLVDDLGLRSITAIFLMITAIIISRRFKSWRPINLSILSLVLLNLVVGVSKLLFGRTKPSSGFDLVITDSGLSYPSGHAANAIRALRSSHSPAKTSGGKALSSATAAFICGPSGPPGHVGCCAATRPGVNRVSNLVLGFEFIGEV